MKEEARFPMNAKVGQCGTNNLETLLFVTSKAGEFKNFDLETKGLLSNSNFDNKNYSYHILTLSHDDKMVLLSSNRSLIHLINVEDPRNPVKLYTADIGFLACGMLFSPDQKWAMTAGA
jgi:hypothetical protein